MTRDDDDLNFTPDDNADEYGHGAGQPPPPPPPPPPDFQGLDMIGGTPVPEDNIDYDYVYGLDYGAGLEKPKRGSGKHYTWLEAWIKAVTEPSVETFEELTADPQATSNRAALWIVVTYIGLYVLLAGLAALRGDLGGVFSNGFAAICCGPVIGVVAVVAMTLQVGGNHLVARLLRGKGSFERLFYAYACFAMPITIAGSVLSQIPCLGVLVGLALGVYAIVLGILAIRAVHRLDTGRAFIAGFAWPIITVCCVITFVCLLGPAIGNTFENVINELITPTPSFVRLVVHAISGR